MNFNNEVPVIILHILKTDVSKNTCIVEQNINATEGLYGCVDNALSVLDAIVVRNRLSSSSLDFIDNNISGLEVPCQYGSGIETDWALDFGRIALPFERSPKIVNHHVGSS